MGDNRDDSFDSRFWGFLGRDRIRGRPLFIYYSFDPQGILPLPFLTAVRWKRIFSTPN
jgi:signal peptidase I